ncbi:MAG: hypothetical protein EOP84_27660 [Verrucomicrobiaceae bacterium]|nr:MAG: hypothetical protein EOP84_27660 [Verrucomicrobiaceae bacterium]
MEIPASNTLRIAVGVFQIALVLAVSAWMFRRAKKRFSVLQVLRAVILISLSALPPAALLIWHPPQDKETYRTLLLTTAFTPLFLAFLLGFVGIYREERQRRAKEHRGPSSRAALRARLEAAPLPAHSAYSAAESDVLPSSCEEATLPVELSFGTREFHQLLIFVAGICFVTGLFGGLAGGHSWRYTMSCALLLPAIFTPLTWLAGCRSTHRSYVISRDGVTIRRYGKDLEQLPWDEIADIRPWPLTLITSSGCRIPFQLGRAEMLRAWEAMLQALAEDEAT